MCELYEYPEFWDEPERAQVVKAPQPAEFEKWLAEKLAPPSRSSEPEPAATETTPA